MLKHLLLYGSLFDSFLWFGESSLEQRLSAVSLKQVLIPKQQNMCLSLPFQMTHLCIFWYGAIISRTISFVPSNTHKNSSYERFLICHHCSEGLVTCERKTGVMIYCNCLWGCKPQLPKSKSNPFWRQTIHYNNTPLVLPVLLRDNLNLHNSKEVACQENINTCSVKDTEVKELIIYSKWLNS